jgi:hypothetical protein
LVEASSADVAFFRKLGKRLVVAAASPEEAIALIMKQVEGRNRHPRSAERDGYDNFAM